MIGKARFSIDKKHRLLLMREWDNTLPKILYIGLNPSTATANKPDNTITRLIHFSKTHGYGGFYIWNLYTMISADFKKVKKSKKPESKDNYKVINEHVMPMVQNVCLMFSKKADPDRVNNILNKLRKLKYKIKLYAFKLTKDGYPWHPLYLPNSHKMSEVVVWLVEDFSGFGNNKMNGNYKKSYKLWYKEDDPNSR